MNILVTGGLGFIGSNFIRLILGKYDYKITNLDKVTYAANPENLRDMKNNPNYNFVKGDICNKTIVNETMRNADMVVHFAAESFVDRSIIDAGEFVRTNVLGTYRLLEAARKFNVGKFIFIGTDEIYGSIEKGSSRETDRLEPRNPYSASKAGADLLVQSYFTTHGLPALTTRSSNNFGPYQHREKLIPLFITNALQDKPLPVYGDGKNVRDWLYVTDNCRAIDLVMHKGRPGGIYNVGGGNERSNLEITNIILRELGKPESLIRFVRDRPGHDRRYSLDSTRIRELGWRPESGFEQALGETVRWYRENQWWWRAL